VDRDPVQPGAERGLATEPDDGAHYTHEHLLGRVRRLVRVGQHAPAERVDIGVGRADQRIERARLTFLAGPDERRVDVHPSRSTSRRPRRYAATRILSPACNQASYMESNLM